MSLKGAENFPLNFLLAVEDRMTRPLEHMRRGQDRFFRSSVEGGKGFVRTYDRMSTGFRRFSREWRQSQGLMGRGVVLFRGLGRTISAGLMEPLRALPGLAGAAGKALAGLGVAAFGMGSALVIAAVRYKKFFLDLNEVMFLTDKQMGKAVATINAWTAELGFSREAVKSVVKQGLQLGFMLGNSAADLKKFTKHTLVLAKATGVAEAGIGQMIFSVHKLYNLGWHGVRQFGLAFKYTADMTSASADELVSFAAGLGDVLAVLPGRSRRQMIGISQDLIMLQGALRDFDVNASSVFSAFTQSMRMSSEEGHRMLQMLAGMLGEDSRELRRKFADSPREFVLALATALQKLKQKTPVVRDLLEREFESAFGISLRDIRGLQRMSRKGLLQTLTKIEEATRKARIEEQTRTKLMDQLTQSWDRLVARITPLMAEIGLPLLKRLTEVAPGFLRSAAKWAAEDFPGLFRRLVDNISNMITAVNWEALGAVVSRSAKLIGKLMVKLGLIKEEELHPERKISRGAAHFLQGLGEREFYGQRGKFLLSTLFYRSQVREHGQKKATAFAKAGALAAMLGAMQHVPLGEIEKAIRQMDPETRRRRIGGVTKTALPGWMIPRLAKVYHEQVEPYATVRHARKLLAVGEQRMRTLLDMLAQDPADVLGTLSTTRSVGGLLERRMRLRSAFERQAKKTGLPRQLLESLARRESGFSMQATSRRGARGIMQLMPDTAAWMQKRLKLKADPLTDQAANLAAGAGLLKVLVNKYGGDLALALAAYNWGAGNVSRALAKAEGDPVRALSNVPIETRRYVQDILSDALVIADTKLGRETPRVPADIRQLDDMLEVLKQIRDQGKEHIQPGVAPLPVPMSGAQRAVLRRAGR